LNEKSTKKAGGGGNSSSPMMLLSGLEGSQIGEIARKSIVLMESTDRAPNLKLVSNNHSKGKVRSKVRVRDSVVRNNF